MIRYTRNILILCITAILTACQSTTEPESETVGATVRFLAPSACARLDTPGDSLNMGVIEFENTSTVASIVPKQLAVRINSTTGGVVMWQFSPSWRNANNAVTPNIDAQTDPIASYIQFDVLPSIPPGGKWTTKLRGSLPNAIAGNYGFAAISDSVKVKTVAGDNVLITMGANAFALTTKASCP